MMVIFGMLKIEKETPTTSNDLTISMDQLSVQANLGYQSTQYKILAIVIPSTPNSDENQGSCRLVALLVNFHTTSIRHSPQSMATCLPPQNTPVPIDHDYYSVVHMQSESTLFQNIPRKTLVILV